MAPTSTQLRVLRFLREHLASHGYPPSVREVQAAFGFASPNAAAKHLHALEAQGLIELPARIARGIRLLGDGGVVDAHLARLPLIGRVAAGAPILVEAHIEKTVTVDRALFKSQPDYLLRVRGDSMLDAGILDGDLLAVHQTSAADNGQIVVARLAGAVTVKVLQRDHGGVRLLPRNRAYAPIVVDATCDFAIEGLYCGLLRNA